MNEHARRALRRSATEIDAAQIRVVAYCDDPELTARERRAIGSIADRLSSVTMRMRQLVDVEDQADNADRQ